MFRIEKVIFLADMPVRNRRDHSGPYFQWGNHGKKYYYNPLSSRSLKIAAGKAMRQCRAAHASKIKLAGKNSTS